MKNAVNTVCSTCTYIIDVSVYYVFTLWLSCVHPCTIVTGCVQLLTTILHILSFHVPTVLNNKNNITSLSGTDLVLRVLHRFHLSIYGYCLLRLPIFPMINPHYINHYCIPDCSNGF
ncbi:hypothetical protein BDB01DRAFT_459278 [Pilobolus umbonatus]|nr:hypothetical protein BDB01DRAFT_459278 [Pilobolus umbonatus]